MRGKIFRSRFSERSFFLCLAFLLSAPVASADIVFVTQTPFPQDFANVGSTFGNQRASLDSAPRGGDLYIRYDNGTLKNLTRAAGYGSDGTQGANAIAVRDPAVHWSGNKVLFSMVIGAATQQYQVRQYFWQLYEITGLGANETPVITKVPNQPVDFNNVMPTYAADDSIIFSSDRPRNGARHLYPQRDEYESTATNTGLWKLAPATGVLTLLDHVPSGAFHPIVDSFGRVIYTRWDHLQQDQQADGSGYGAFNFASEAANAARLNEVTEVFPEPRAESRRLSPLLNLHTLNFFFPWQINQDGTDAETLNHIGRHELADYFDRSFNNDGNLFEFYDESQSFNKNRIQAFLQIQEDPLNPGTFLGINAPEFETHASGQVIRMNGVPSLTADQMEVVWLTHPDTANPTDSPDGDHSGLYRNPLRLMNGTFVASHTANTRGDSNIGTTGAPRSRYDFRLKTLAKIGNYYVPSQTLTSGITRNLQWWSPDVSLSYSGFMWELQPVELRSRTRPPQRQSELENIEAAVFNQLGLDIGAFQNYLRQNNLALIVTRDVTSRDEEDRQQPFNLRVTGTQKQRVGAGGKIYDVSHLQIFQGDQIRGYGGVDSPQDGRRVLAQPLHDGHSLNLPNPGGPAGSVRIASDGSAAAIVPAQRALSWQLTDASGNGVVRERFWLTFQPGEIRMCTSCHGLNTRDQTGVGKPTNTPQALVALLTELRNLPAPPTNPDPPANPDPSPPPTTSSYSLRTVGMDAKKKVYVNALFSGLPAGMEIIRQNGAGAESLTLSVRVENQLCPTEKPLILNESGVAQLFTKISAPSRFQLFLFFDIKKNGAVVGSNISLLVNLKGKKTATPLPQKDLLKLCSQLMSFR